MAQRTTNAPTRALMAAAVVTTAILAGCSSAYYSAWEMLGQEKRDLYPVSHSLSSRDYD